MKKTTSVLLPVALFTALLFTSYLMISHPKASSEKTSEARIQSLEFLNQETPMNWFFQTLNVSSIGVKLKTLETVVDQKTIEIDVEKGEIRRITNGINNTQVNVTLEPETYLQVVQLLREKKYGQAVVTTLIHGETEPKYKKIQLVARFI